VSLQTILEGMRLNYIGQNEATSLPPSLCLI
jgi:hypothetical protein